MTELASFEIRGVPAPQGSKVKMPNGAMVEGGSKTGRAKHAAWRNVVSDKAHDIADHEPYDGALRLYIEFRMPMPTSRPKLAQQLGMWPHSVKPDIDKLIRCTLDGLKDGGLIRDDARVFALNVEAWEVIGWTGAMVRLERCALLEVAA